MTHLYLWAIIGVLSLAVMVLGILLGLSKRAGSCQVSTPCKNAQHAESPLQNGQGYPLLTRQGPHTIELLKDVFSFYIPISRLEEYKDIKISVLVPSRARPEMLRASLTSVLELASEPDRVQIIVRCDLDDLSMAGFEFPACSHFKLLRGDRMRGYASLHYFYTECAIQASGPLLLLWNDDAQMKTFGWDAELWNETAERRERGLYGFWALANNHWPYAFPVVTRSITEHLGAFSKMSYNDAYLFELAKACGIEQPVLEKIQVQHDMLPEACLADGLGLRLYHSGFFQNVVHADANVLKEFCNRQ